MNTHTLKLVVVDVAKILHAGWIFAPFYDCFAYAKRRVKELNGDFCGGGSVRCKQKAIDRWLVDLTRLSVGRCGL